MNIGDTFWFAGRNLELVQLKDMIAYVKRAKGTKSKVPSWQGGRMSLSSNMTTILRRTMQEAIDGNTGMIELETIAPILNVQKEWSLLPNEHQFLIEKSFSEKVAMYSFTPLKEDMYTKACLHW